MPFDIADFQIPAEAKEADPFDYRTFTPGHDGLRKLAWVLRHRETWPSDFHWRFNSCQNCAMGLASRLAGVNCFYAIPAFRIFPPDDASRMFGIGGDLLPQGVVIQPEDVASAIDSYLARAEALAKSEA